ncbi:MAG: DsbE family thiol:disulfide interchange protein [Pseudomonadota bacterium]
MSQETTQQNEAPRKFPYLALLPVALAAALMSVFAMSLFSGKDNSLVPSPLVGKPAPEFALAAVPGIERNGEALPGFSTADLKGAPVTLVNVWASWCIPCRAEHPFIEALAKVDGVQIFGLNHKDQPENAKRFLDELGNPYVAVGGDRNGRVSIDFGVYGVPETFVVNSEGRIVYKFIGPITESRLRNELQPEIEKILTASSTAPATQ